MLKEGAFANRKLRTLLVCQLVGWTAFIVGEMADSVIVGVFLNSDAVSAAGIVTSIYTGIYFFNVFVSVGTAIMYFRKPGALRVEKSRKTAGMGLMVSILIGIFTDAQRR